MSVGRVWHGVALVLGAFLPVAGWASVPAQEPDGQEPPTRAIDLGNRVVAAARRFQQTELRRLVANATLDDLFVVFAARRADLRGQSWDRVVAALATRRAEIWASWYERPECRRRWASVLAKCEWFHDESVARHSAADADERLDFEFVAAHTVPAAFETWLRHADTRLQASGRALYRASVTGQIEQVEACTAVARAKSAFHVWAFVANDRTRVSPFVLRGALADPDDRVRARASWALRRLLNYEQRPEVVAMLGEETQIPRLGLNERTARRMARALDAGSSPASAMVRSTTQGALPAAARRRLAEAFMAAAERVPPDPDPNGRKPVPGGPSGSQAPTREFQLASGYFRQAAELHPEHYRAVLGLAANADTGDVSVRAMHALAQLDSMPLEVARRSAGIVLALLDDGDARVADDAAVLADRLLAQTADAALLDRLVAIAADALEHDRGRLFFAHEMDISCVVGVAPRHGPPANRSSQALFTAASHRGNELVQPLIAALELALAAKDEPPKRRGRGEWDTSGSHRHLLLESLVRLAPGLSSADAEKLFRLLRPRLGAAGLRLAPNFEVDSSLVPAVIRALFVSVPEELLRSYDAALADDAQRRSLLTNLGRLEAVPADRARYVLQTGRDAHAIQSVGVFAPELLVEEWRAGGERRRNLTSAMIRLSADRCERMIALATAGHVPKELGLRAFGYSIRTLSELAALLPPTLVTADEWGPKLARRIERAAPSSAAEDIGALRTLGTTRVQEVVLAVIRRARQLGEAGRAVAAEVVQRQLAQDDHPDITAVVREALLADVPIPNLAAVLVRLQADRPVDPDNPSAVVVAVELRLRPVARLRALPRPQPAAIAMAGIDVQPGLMRELFPERLAEQLHLFLSGSSRTRCGALALAAQERTWSTSLDREVVRQLTHESADVRLAAYLALATRDPGVCSCSLFENEAVFDPDPRIRALAR